jgi:cytochrome c-type biogenesis protein CcmH/NrfG
MITLPRLVSWLGLSLLLLSSAAAREKWIYARTEHFEMFSSASERESRELLNKLEQFRATVLKIFPLRHDHEPRATVILFETDRRFEPYKPLYNGQPKDVAGYFVGSPDEAVIALTNDHDFEVTMEIIFHEHVHLLLQARGDNPPPWLNEGLAELFSTFTIEGDTFQIGRAKPAHVTLLSQSGLLSLAHLFAVTRQSPEYNEGERRGIFYAESWALLHFLVFGEERTVYLPKLMRFLELLSSPGAAIDKCFREAFATDYNGMQMNLRSYLQRGSYYVSSGKLLLGDLSSQIKFRPAGDFERDLALLNLRWRVQHPANTAYQLRQMAEVHPESPRPHEVLAAVAMQEHDASGALNHWQRAAELGSDNAYVYWQLARDKLQQVITGLTLDYRMPADLVATLRDWLDRAVALSPDYLEAYGGLAVVEAVAEQPRIEVINRVQQVVPQMRDKTRTLFALALVRWRAGDYVTSRKITEALLASPQASAHWGILARQLNKRLPPSAEEPAAPAATGAAETP